MIDPARTEPSGVEPGQENSSLPRSWQVLAVAGAAIGLLSALFRSFPVRDRQEQGLLTFILVVAATAATARFLFAPAWRAITARPALLVPIGVVLLAQEVLGWLARVPVLSTILAPSLSGQLLGLSLALSVGVVLGIALWAAFAAWQTDLLIRDVSNPGSFPTGPWESIWRGFLPSLAAIALGTLGLLAGLIPCLAMFAASRSLGLVALVVLAVGWNLATAALLPTVLLKDGPIASRLVAGFRQSWRLKSRWWGRLLAQFLLLGLMTYSYSSTTTTTSTPGGTSISESVTSSYHIHASWVGGYENEEHWYADASANTKSEPVPVLAWLLGVEFLILTVAMKWTIIRTILGKEGASLAEERLLAADPGEV